MENENESGAATNPDNSTVSQNQTEGSPQFLTWEGISEADQKYINNKGYKSPADLLKSYREAESALGKKISIPEDGDADGWNKLYAKLGRPETADKYDIEVTDELKSDVQKLMFEAGLTQKQSAVITQKYNEILNGYKAKLDAQAEEQSKKDLAEIEAEWGDNLAKNKELTERGAKEICQRFELSEDDMHDVELAIGTKKFVKLVKTVGELMAEDGLPSSNTTKFRDDMDPVEFYKEILKG